jgi:putative endonuclease
MTTIKKKSLSKSSTWYVYILLCRDKSLYTGIAKNLKKRFKDHLTGKGSKYVRAKKPLKIVYSAKMTSLSKALTREAKIKKFSRQEKSKLISEFSKRRLK